MRANRAFAFLNGLGSTFVDREDESERVGAGVGDISHIQTEEVPGGLERFPRVYGLHV